MHEFPYPTDSTPAPARDGADGLASNGMAVHQQPLTDRLAQGAHHTIDRLAETAGPHIERMEGAVADAAGHLKDQARQAREVGDAWADGLRSSVRRNPLAAVALALAVGTLIARIRR
jgi:hypothetical protein